MLCPNCQSTLTEYGAGLRCPNCGYVEPLASVKTVSTQPLQSSTPNSPEQVVLAAEPIPQSIVSEVEPDQLLPKNIPRANNQPNVPKPVTSYSAYRNLTTGVTFIAIGIGTGIYVYHKNGRMGTALIIFALFAGCGLLILVTSFISILHLRKTTK